MACCYSIETKEIPVVFVDMTPEQMRIATLRHNRARGSEDVELSIKILQDLRELGALEHAIDSLQITDRELKVLIDDLPAPEQMAADEFSKAWIPSDIGEEAKTQHFEDKESHISKQAMDMKKEMTESLQNATSLMNQGEINKRASKKFATVTIIMEGKKASFVKKTLGEEKPAEILLKMSLIKAIEDPKLLTEVLKWYPNLISDYRRIMGHSMSEELVAKVHDMKKSMKKKVK